MVHVVTQIVPSADAGLGHVQNFLVFQPAAAGSVLIRGKFCDKSVWIHNYWGF
jgi:hypothetical protein